jgi:hypothetical protein
MRLNKLLKLLQCPNLLISFLASDVGTTYPLVNLLVKLLSVRFLYCDVM